MTVHCNKNSIFGRSEQKAANNEIISCITTKSTKCPNHTKAKACFEAVLLNVVLSIVLAENLPPEVCGL